MEIKTGEDGVWKYLVLMVVFACLVASGVTLALSGRLSLHAGASPEEEARAEVMRTVAVTATAQALRQKEELHQVELARREMALRMDTVAAERWESVKAVARGVGMGLLIGTLVVLAAAAAIGGVYALGRVKKERLAPVVRITRVGFGLVAVSSSDGMVMIVDELTGQRGLLGEAAAPDPERATALVEMVQNGKPVDELFGKSISMRRAESGPEKVTVIDRDGREL